LFNGIADITKKKSWCGTKMQVRAQKKIKIFFFTFAIFR